MALFKIEDIMKQKRTKFSKRINLVITVCVVCFALLFTVGLRARQLALETADEEYRQSTLNKMQEWEDYLDDFNKGDNNNTNDPTYEDAIIYDNFYDLADAINERESKGGSYKYSASGTLAARAVAFGIKYDTAGNISYARALNQKGNKLFNVSGGLAESTLKDVIEKAIGNTADFNNTYFYNATLKQYKYKQYHDPTLTAKKEVFENRFAGIDIARNMFKITSDTITQVHSFEYDENTELYKVVASVDPDQGTETFRTFVSSILGGTCPTSASKLTVTLTVRKDYVITSAEYNMSMRLLLSGVGINGGYVDLDGPVVEKLQSYGQNFTLNPSL